MAKPPAARTLGQALRRCFADGGNRRELADLLDVSLQTVSRWATDREIPQRLIDFTPLADYLGVTREQLGALIVGTIEQRARLVQERARLG